jgi:hypothetical protein
MSASYLHCQEAEEITGEAGCVVTEIFCVEGMV